MIQQHIIKAAENAAPVTYGGATATAVFWGLHVSDICMIVSTLVTLCGFGLQMFIALHRLRRLERAQDATKLAVGAVSHSAQGVAARVEAIEKAAE